MNIDKSDAINSRAATNIGADTAKGSSAATARTRSPEGHSAEPLTLSPALQAILDSSRTTLTSEIDGQRVEGIRQAIADGTYHVDPNRLAERFLELETIIDQ